MKQAPAVYTRDVINAILARDAMERASDNIGDDLVDSKIILVKNDGAKIKNYGVLFKYKDHCKVYFQVSKDSPFQWLDRSLNRWTTEEN